MLHQKVPMSLYSCATDVGSETAGAGCGCVACRFGHGTKHPARERRYTSDTTDEQWAILEAVLPWPVWLDGSGGRPEEHCRRTIIDAIFYVADNGCKWR